MQKFFLYALLILPAIIFTLDIGNRKMLSFAAESDPLEDEAEIEEESEQLTTEEEIGEEEEKSATSSPDADTTLIFVKPIASSSQLEIPAGSPVEFLVGFRNKGKQDFILKLVEASFRYPMDFNFYIQNFSAIVYNKLVLPEQEATLAYSFIPSESFAGRPFGLNINLAYQDASGNAFQHSVYNETVQVVELEEGLDGETFFLYVFLIAGVVLLLVIGQQTLLSVGKKRISRKVIPVETGTSNPNNVDYDWLPKQTLASLNKEKLPKTFKQQSPRQRKVKRSTGSE